MSTSVSGSNMWYIINGEVTGSYGNSISYTSPSGTGLVASNGTVVMSDEPEVVESIRGKKKVKGAKEVASRRAPILSKKFSPKLYFRFVKSKLDQPAQEHLREQLNKLKPLLIAARQSGQRALYEKLSVHAAVIVKEQEALAIGCGTRLQRSLIDNFISRIEGKVVKFDQLMNFPRPIPAKVRKRIEEVRKTLVFDSYHILYVDYTEEKPLKTVAKKIREKDPILFGCFKFQPDVFYFIVDWVDQYCDITLSKVIADIRLDDPEYELDQVPEVSEDYFQNIVKQVNNSFDRLKKTNRDNFEELADSEDAEALVEVAEVKLKEADTKLGEVNHLMERMECMFKNFKKKILGTDKEEPADGKK